MGSAAQKKYALHLVAILKSLGLKVMVHHATVSVPFLRKPLAESSKQGASELTVSNTVFRKIVVSNVVGLLKGAGACSVLWGGHFDTKASEGKRLLGANDGGSSTALLLELARITAMQRKNLKKISLPEKKNTIEKCDFIFAFFDGEEAGLPDWTDGERLLGVPDHLYGSRTWVDENLNAKNIYKVTQKPLSIAVILDMIGHKNQKIFVTSGSDAQATEALLKSADGVKIQSVPFPIEDDHIPFAQRGVRFMHLIDWTNLDEWHTEKDDLSIISVSKIAALGKVLLHWMREEVPYEWLP